MGHSLLTSSTMKVAIVVLAFLAAAGAQPMDPKFTCSECVHEMHQLGWMVKYAAEDIHNYLVANYCPTTGDPSCPENLSWLCRHVARCRQPLYRGWSRPHLPDNDGV